MKRILLFLFSMVCVVSVLLAQNSSRSKTTYVYSVKGADTLKLDKYDKLSPGGGLKPCLIYVFGGGFVGGVRESDSYDKFFNNILDQGYSVISIDYRLGLKDVGDPSEFPAALANSITMAVEDLFDATRYVLDNAAAWNIDKNMIVACGSSAGAITVLQAEYAICNREELTKSLPQGFNYAGIIAFAGAIFDTYGRLHWANKPAPIQLFHGDADNQVPFDKIEVMNAGFYGSKHIAEQLDRLQYPYYFYKVENAAHEIAGIPMAYNLNEVNTFLEQFVKEKRPLIINTSMQQIGKPEMEKDFTVMDYVDANIR